MVNYQTNLVNRLECPSNRKAETAFFTRQKEIRQLASESECGIRIIKIDQAKRHIDNRNLHAQFHPDTGAKIAELGKRAVVNPHERIGLCLAAQIDLLKPAGQTHRTTETIATAEIINKLRAG